MTDVNGLNELLVHSIGDIEAAVARVQAELDPRLWREVSDRLTKEAASLGWVAVVQRASDIYWLAPAEWTTTDEGEPDADFYFTLDSQRGLSDAHDVTDLAPFVGASAHGNRMALSFEQDALKPAKWRKLLREQSELLLDLRDTGFVVDVEHGAIAYEVRLAPDLLAAAFVDDDFDVSLQPVADALKAAVQLQSTFERLSTVVRKRQS